MGNEGKRITHMNPWPSRGDSSSFAPRDNKEGGMRHSAQEQLVWFTTLGQRTYGRYEVQRAGGVGSNRHLERVVSGIYTIAAGTVKSRSADL